MNLFINSPIYYSQEKGIIDDIYKMCSNISKNIDLSIYTNVIDIIGITPIIAPEEFLKEGKYKEIKLVSLKYRMANISLHSNYNEYCISDIERKKEMILDNIFRSLYVIKRKLKEEFDYKQIESEIIKLVVNTDML